jgi:putative membrane protein
MKKPVIKMLLLGFAVGGMFMTSCKQEPKAEDTKEVAEDQNEAKFDDTNDAKEDDSQYLVAAAEKDLEEIETGKLALSKGTDPEVKKFGQMMIDDHTKASSTTKPLAEKKNITLPMALTDKGKEHYDDLNDEKAGKDFDMKYADMMVDGHEDAISKLTDASEKASDPEIRSWAGNMVPTLQMHLEHAKMLQEKIKNKK